MASPTPRLLLRPAARLAAVLLLVAALAPALASAHVLGQSPGPGAFGAPLRVAEALHARGLLDDAGLDAARDLAATDASLTERRDAAARLDAALGGVQASRLGPEDARELRALAEAEAQAFLSREDGGDAESDLPCKAACTKRFLECLRTCLEACAALPLVEGIQCLLDCLFRCLAAYVTCLLSCRPRLGA